MSIGVTMLTPYRLYDSPQMSGSGETGLNWYSARLAKELSICGANMAIVAPRRRGEVGKHWVDGAVHVYSSYARGAIGALPDAVRTSMSLRNTVVHVQHELFAFGGLRNAFCLPLAILLLRLRGFKVLTTIHGVMALDSITPQFVRANQVPGGAFASRLIWRGLIRAVGCSSTRIHVHEAFFRDLLVSDYKLNPARINVVPMGIEPLNAPLDRDEARDALNLPKNAHVVLFFGYLSAYKGIEYLTQELDGMLRADSQLHVLIAGGVPSRLKGDCEPLQNFLQSTKRRSRVHVLGFVPDQAVSEVFAASDVLLLPYSVAISSSGPLALAAGYGLPVLMSAAFSRFFPSAPGLFETRSGELGYVVSKFFSDKQFRSDCEGFISTLKGARPWPTVARMLLSIYRELVGAKTGNGSV